jgi:4-amino-4-deoxy-L-arabinose transferase-like glycosyltransferase
MAVMARPEGIVADLPLAAWALLVAISIAARLLAYSGFFGSDEVTYTASAYALLAGDWSVSSYVGANRFGVNLPVAALGMIFGQSEASAAAYAMLCSLLEIALVASLGVRMIGARAAWAAGMVLASLPIHVHYAGRLMADSPLCLAVTASFLFFWYGESSGRKLGFLLAGFAAGWSFWIKPAVAFYVVVLMVYPLVFRRFDWRWTWTAVGFGSVVLANCAFFWALTGRFWFLFETVSERRGSGYLERELAAGTLQNDPWYYLVYLFAKVYHTWLLGFLALVTTIRWVRKRRGDDQPSGLSFVLFWAVGLFAVLSVLPVSFSPLVFIPKQTNYMLIFVAPLALLAGDALARLGGWGFAVALSLVVAPALVLALLLQASVTVFTANSKAVVKLALENPGTTLYTNTNPHRAASFHSALHPGSSRLDVRFVGELAPKVQGSRAAGGERLAVIDLHTLSWGRGEPFRSLKDLPACWSHRGTLTPIVEGGGVQLLQLALALLEAGGGAESGLASRLRLLTVPEPAHVFRIPDGACD